MTAQWLALRLPQQEGQRTLATLCDHVHIKKTMFAFKDPLLEHSTRGVRSNLMPGAQGVASPSFCFWKEDVTSSRTEVLPFLSSWLLGTWSRELWLRHLVVTPAAHYKCRRHNPAGTCTCLEAPACPFVLDYLAQPLDWVRTWLPVALNIN